MRVKVLLGALAVSLAASFSAGAQTDPGSAGEPGNVPTVTIINKAPVPAAPAEPAPPTLTVSPTAPERPSAAASPVRPADPSGARPPAGARSTTLYAEEAKTPDQSEPADEPVAPQAVVPATPAASPEAAAVVEAPAPPPEPTLGINIDLTRQVMTVSEHGALKYTWKVSSARYGYRTPTGTFRPTWMSKMWYSRQYDYAPMPHAVFFHKGVAIHATYATGMLGRPASHGCVRLAPKNAAVLYRLVSEHGKARTEIVVHGTPDQSSARVASQDYDQDYNTVPMRRAGQYRYLPPSYAQRGYSAYGGPPPGYYYAQPRTRRYYAQPRRYQPRGLYNSYSYGYGF
jgi:lipoprotein-anchoring transpeptidase ErfK/SrfK